MKNLPEDEREREIFLRALLLYSETCEAPELKPDCPFSIDVGPGQRSCGEECLELLEHHDISRLAEGINMGNGIFIRQNIRPSRYPKLQEKAFDAREIYLTDIDKVSPRQWRLPSLLKGLVEEVSCRPPLDSKLRKERRDHIEEIISIVEEHGINFEDQLLSNLRPFIGASAVASIFRFYGDENVSAEKDLWSIFLKEQFDKTKSPVRDTVEDFMDIIFLVTKWSYTASYDDLIAWIPPKQTESSELTITEELEIDLYGGWMMDRFTETYLDRWSIDSLRKEWLYLHGKEQAPCLSSDMNIRKVPKDKIAKIMADRLTTGQTHSRASLVYELVAPSLEFIREGRRKEAAALFEASIRIDPANADAYNNLGFCILPDDSKKALKYFKKALDLGGTHNRHIHIANRILAFSILGKRESVLKEARDFTCPDWSKGQVTYMWKVESLIDSDSQEPEIMECQDLDEYVQNIVRSFGITE